MKEDVKEILWVDDEIELLKSHILFLEGKGCKITPAATGEDALVYITKQPFDLVLLDEQMPGKDGLATLEEIKDAKPNLPVVMVTKSEEENIMNQAIGKKIDDYLTKPVNPSQVWSTIKKVLDAKKIRGGQLAHDYIAEFNRLRGMLFGQMHWKDWMEAHRKLSEWDLEIAAHPEVGLAAMHFGQKKEFNVEFSKYVEKAYSRWVQGEDAPPLSVNIVKNYLFPHLSRGKQVFFVVVDCMRLDQWLMIEPLVHEYFNIQRDYYYSVLPTATPFSRNAIFAGLFPDDIARVDAEAWSVNSKDDTSRNRHERQFLDAQMSRLGLKLKGEAKYVKVLDQAEGDNLARKISNYAEAPLLSVVYNFVDMLAHGRSEDEILSELAHDEAAFRSVMQSWFLHSSLFELLKQVSKQDCAVVITTDHGSVLGTRAALAYGKRDASTSLRYKYGDNLNCDAKQAVLIKDPRRWRLPVFGIATTYIIAKEDYYFVYPTNFNEYQRAYKNSFQHGGISMEEMILPVVTLTTK